VLCAALPVAGRVASPYGWRWLNGRSDLHTGIDIGAPEGAPVFAMLPGVVVLAAPSGQIEGYGNVVVLEHAPGFYSLSAHLSAMLVRTGQLVARGEQLGAVGRTAGTRADPGRMFGASGAHLHLEFLTRWPPGGRDVDRIDPALVLGPLGVIVPHEGPLQQAACVASDAPVLVERPLLAPTAPARPRSSSSAGLGLLLALWAAHRYYAGRADG
jgi:murein DD-endopeptidase MepM/ murein hydrolase activator NlpD